MPPGPVDETAERALPRGLLLTLAVLGAASLVPVVAVRYPPLPDLSEHLAAVSVLHHIADPAYDLQRYYELRLGLNPYWGYYAPVHLLAYPLGVELASRAVLGLYLCAVPLGMALLASRLGRSPWLCLLSFPVLWNHSFALGFLPFCVGLALLPYALVAFDRLCERPTLARAALAALLGVASYLAHLLAWGAWLACAGVIGLLHGGRTPVRMAARAAAWCSSLAVGLVLTLRGQALDLDRVSSHLAWKRYPTRQSLGELFQWVWADWLRPERRLALGALLLAWLWLKLSAPRRPTTLHDLRAEGLFAVALGAYLVLPRSLTEPAYWWGINIRFACLALLFLPLTIEGTIDVSRGGRRLALLLAAAVAVGFAGLTTADWLRSARFCEGYDRLRDIPEPGARVLFVLGRPWRDREASVDYAHTYYGTYQAQRGGYMPWDFDVGFPLRYRVRYPSGTWRQQRFDWDRDGPYYDYVFAFNHNDGRIFGTHLAEVRKVGEARRWSLWRLPGPRRDDSPWPAYPSPLDAPGGAGGGPATPTPAGSGRDRSGR